MYNVRLRIGDFKCEYPSAAGFKALYKTATMCAKQCFKSQVRFRMVVENGSGNEVLRVFTYHSESKKIWIARVASAPHSQCNKYGLTLRRDNY